LLVAQDTANNIIKHSREKDVTIDLFILNWLVFLDLLMAPNGSAVSGVSER